MSATWKTREGAIISITSLTDSHLLNLERWLRFEGRTAPGVHPTALEEKRGMVWEEIQVRGLTALPSIASHSTPACPFEAWHCDAVDIEDYYHCWFCA